MLPLLSVPSLSQVYGVAGVKSELENPLENHMFSEGLFGASGVALLVVWGGKMEAKWCLKVAPEPKWEK